jgi:omega-amidase
MFCFFPFAGYFAEYAETVEGGESSRVLSDAAKDNNVYVIGGSFPERKDDKLFNTCTVWDPTGGLVAVHRKVNY